MATGNDNPPRGFWARIGSAVLDERFWTFLWRMTAMMMMILLFLAAALVIYNSTRADGGGPLEHPEFTRGLITLMLLTCAVAVVMLVTLASVFSDSDDSRAKIVAAGKEILAPVLGILGTIIGFYFGSVTAKEAASTQPPPAPQVQQKSSTTAPGTPTKTTTSPPAPPAPT